MKQKTTRALLKELIELYELRLKAKKSLERVHGKTKAAGILFETRQVIRDLKELL